MFLDLFLCVYLPLLCFVSGVPEAKYSRVHQLSSQDNQDDEKGFIDGSVPDSTPKLFGRPSNYIFNWNFVPSSITPEQITTMKPRAEENTMKVEISNKRSRNGEVGRGKNNRKKNVSRFRKNENNNKLQVDISKQELNISNISIDDTYSDQRERKQKNKNRIKSKNKGKPSNRKPKHERNTNGHNKKRKSDRKIKRGRKQRVNNFDRNNLPELKDFNINENEKSFKPSSGNTLNSNKNTDDIFFQMHHIIPDLVKYVASNETNFISNKETEIQKKNDIKELDTEGDNTLLPIFRSDLLETDHNNIDRHINITLTEDKNYENASIDTGETGSSIVRLGVNDSVDHNIRFSSELNFTKHVSDLITLLDTENMNVTYQKNEEKEFDALDEVVGDISCLAGTFLPAPPSQNAAIRYVRTQTATTANLVAEYECEPAHHLENPKVYQVICSERKWMGTVPSCISDFPRVEKRVECHGGKGNCDHLCEVIGNNTVCTCYKGFRFENGVCKDINECDIENGGCEKTCRNTPGSHHCKCPSGFRLADNRRTCVDINECLLRNGHGPCQDTCHNKWGSYECSCRGMTGTRLSADGHTCQDIDECADGTAGCSHTCLNTFGSAFCLCPSGFMLGDDWKTCQDIDECSYDELQSEQCELGCVNTVGSYHCLGPQNDDTMPSATTEVLVSCPSGFFLDNDGNCKDTDECKERTSGCDQGCLNTKGSFQCYCGLGFKLAPDNRSCIEGKEAVCPPLDSPVHGYWECARHLVRTKKSRFPWMKRTRVVNHAGAICQLKCPHGYILEGEYRKTCGQDSKWKGPDDGTCVRKLDYMFNVILKA